MPSSAQQLVWLEGSKGFVYTEPSLGTIFPVLVSRTNMKMTQFYSGPCYMIVNPYAFRAAHRVCSMQPGSMTAVPGKTRFEIPNSGNQQGFLP